METSSENCKKLNSNQKSSHPKKKLTKKSKSFLIKDPVNISKKSSKKNDPTPLKSRHSFNKENSIIKETSSLLSKNAAKVKQTYTSSFKKKVFKNVKNLKKQYSRGTSLCDTRKKNQTNPLANGSKPVIKGQQSCNELRIPESSNKLTPRSAHPSPQYSHRTPDSIRLTQRSNIPVLTEKKTKIPEVGYYCKRFSLFDKNKLLYTDQSHLSHEKEISKTEVSEDNIRKSDLHMYENIGENNLNREDFSSITKTLKLDNISESPDSVQIENNTSPVKIPIFDSYKSPSPNRTKKCLEKNPFESQRSEKILKKNPFVIEENTFSTESFVSPTKTIALLNSPERKQIKTPESINKKHKNEPKAPKKGLAELESPGSFVFSLSSNSSDDFLCQEVFIKEFRERVSEKKDEEIQTDLLEMITDEKLIQGLKIIGKISECISLK